MIPGNCLVCSLALWIVYGGRIVVMRREPGFHATSHFLVHDRTGRFRNFRRVRDILPFPLNLLVFLGRFEVRDVHGSQACARVE